MGLKTNEKQSGETTTVCACDSLFPTTTKPTVRLATAWKVSSLGHIARTVWPGKPPGQTVMGSI